MPSIQPEAASSPKVAIVVPVCNVAGYLRECLDSLLSQSYENFTVFAVDDGSTDGSGRILDEYAAADARIVPIHQANAGQGAARNSALGRIEALGGYEYVAFADSDDRVREDFVAGLVGAARRTGADITVCAYTRFDDSGARLYGRLSEERVLDREAYFEFVVAAGARPEFRGISGTGGWVWNKLFSARTLEGVRFVTDRDVVEDEIFCVQAGERSRRNVYFPEPLYLYRQRPGSDVRQSAFSRRLLAMRMKIVPLAFSPRTELVAVAALAVAAVNCLSRYGRVPDADLRSFRLKAEATFRGGHLSRHALRRFILMCDHPLLSRLYMAQRHFFSSLRFWGKKERS